MELVSGPVTAARQADPTRCPRGPPGCALRAGRFSRGPRARWNSSKARPCRERPLLAVGHCRFTRRSILRVPRAGPWPGAARTTWRIGAFALQKFGRPPEKGAIKSWRLQPGLDTPACFWKISAGRRPKRPVSGDPGAKFGLFSGSRGECQPHVCSVAAADALARPLARDAARLQARGNAAKSMRSIEIPAVACINRTSRLCARHRRTLRHRLQPNRGWASLVAEATAHPPTPSPSMRLAPELQEQHSNAGRPRAVLAAASCNPSSDSVQSCTPDMRPHAA